jgi:excisionase family DNA binding protein
MAKLLTSHEVQAMINVDLSTVYRMAEDGRLPGVKVGRQWRFPSERVSQLFGIDHSVTNGLDHLPAPATRAVPDLATLLQPEVAQSIADLIGESLGTMALITDLQGRPLTEVANPCGFYAAITDRPMAAQLCASEWRQFADEPHIAPRFIRTWLGFLCARTFVWVDLTPVGMILAGGVKPTGWPPPAETIQRLADALAMSASDLAAAANEVWDLDAEQRERALRLLPRYGDVVSQLASARNQIRTPQRPLSPSLVTPS